jgi:hypothetical protein
VRSCFRDIGRWTSLACVRLITKRNETIDVRTTIDLCSGLSTSDILETVGPDPSLWLPTQPLANRSTCLYLLETG